MALYTYTSCTACGNSFQRKHPQLAVWVCPQCYKVHAPTEAAVEQQQPVPEDMTLFSFDSVLEMEGSRYQFAGRYQYQMLNAYKNNWVLINEQGEVAYLFESTGHYAFCKALPKGFSSQEASQLVLGNDMLIQDHELYIDEVDKNEITFYAGELPETGRHGVSFFAADLSNNDGHYAFVQLFDKKQSIVYFGRCGSFADFTFSQTRDADDWK